MILWGLDFIKLIQSTLESPFMDFLMNLYGGNDYGNKNFSSRLRTQSNKLG